MAIYRNMTAMFRFPYVSIDQPMRSTYSPTKHYIIASKHHNRRVVSKNEQHKVGRNFFFENVRQKISCIFGAVF